VRPLSYLARLGAFLLPQGRFATLTVWALFYYRKAVLRH